MKNLLVAMSGGVDSAVAALLLKRQGTAITGVYMKNWINEENILGDCPWQQDIVDARAVADHLGIPFRVVNFMEDYKSRIVDFLLAGYKRGITPNPDVMCNREMKFGVLLDYALKHGFDGVATGHYVRKRENPGGSFDLLEGVDDKKNQSYFLALLRQEQVARAWFPIGDLRKTEVRALADEAGLPNARKKDSQGICFIGNIRMGDFLRHYIRDEPGEIADTDGRVLGKHRGLHLHTLGQRRGLGIPSNTDHEHYVVVGKDLAANRLIVAFDRPDSPGLYQRSFTVHHLSFVNQPIPDRHTLLARPRYLDPLQKIEYERLTPDTARVVFAEPQRAITPGQVIAFHEDDVLLGGAVYA